MPTENRAPLVVHVHHWEELRQTLQHLDGYVFRGHASADWNLTPTLWRSFAGDDPTRREHIERSLGFSFRRRAHHFAADLPARNRGLEWLALLRHYGAPSRLMDVSRSPYAAAFFALEQIERGATHGCVWAIHENAVRTNAAARHRALTGRDDFTQALMSPHDDTNEALFNDLESETAPLVTLAEPFRLNARVSLQHGAFLVPLSLSGTFYGSLLNTLSIDAAFLPKEVTFDPDVVNPGLPRESTLVQIVFPTTIRSHALRDLDRMNVTAETLYQGLEGFVRQLSMKAELGLL